MYVKEYSAFVFLKDFCSICFYIQVSKPFLVCFLHMMLECSNFIHLDVIVQFSQHHLWKKLSFLHFMFFIPLSQINLPYVCIFIEFLSCLINLYFYFVTSAIWFYFSFVVQSGLREPDSTSSIFSFSRQLWLLWVFCVAMQFSKF